MNILTGLAGLLIAVLFISGLCWAGSGFLCRIGVRPALHGRMPFLSYSFAAGFALTSSLLTLTAWAGLFRPWLAIVLLSLVSLAGVAFVLRCIRGGLPDVFPVLRATWFPLLLLTAFSFPALILPPTAQDAMFAHLEYPKQVLLQGQLPPALGNAYFHFPMGVDICYALFLAVFPPAAVQCVHFGFLLATVFAVFESLSAMRISLRPSLSVSLLTMSFCTVPTLWVDATWAYMDVAWMFFTFLLFSGPLFFWKHRDPGVLIPPFLVLGFYFSVKYPGYYYVLFLALGVAIGAGLYKYPFPVRSRALLWSLAFFLLTSSPWLIRNVASTGNPVYPFFTGVFSQNAPDAQTSPEVGLRGILRTFGAPYQGWKRPVAFLVPAYSVELDQPDTFDGVVGPFLLLLAFSLPVLWKRGDERAPLLWVLGISLVGWGFVLRETRFLLPLLPCVLFVVLWGHARCERFPTPVVRRGGAVLFGFCILFNAFVLRHKLADFDALGYMTGAVSKEEYLMRHLPVYRAQKFINEKLPPTAVVWNLMAGSMNFYLERKCLGEFPVEDYSFHNWLAQYERSGDIAGQFRRRGATHVLVNHAKLLDKKLYIDFAEADLERKIALLFHFFQKETRTVFASGDFAVFEILPAG